MGRDVRIPRQQFVVAADYATLTYGNRRIMDTLGPMTKDDVVDLPEATISKRAATISQ